MYPVRYNWSDKKEKLENVLDDFISRWSYKELGVYRFL